MRSVFLVVSMALIASCTGSGESAPTAPADAAEDLGGLCGASSTTADFDGDGQDEGVAVGFADCDTESGTSVPTMVVSWSSGESESWVLEQCGIAQPEGPPQDTGICEVFAAPDLNDDGRAELAVKVQQAAGSIALLQFYELTPGEPTQSPIQVAPGGPGPVEITPGQVATLMFGSSPDYEENVRCTTSPEGEAIFLVTVAESQGDQWSVFEATWRYDGRLLSITSQDTYTTSKDSPDTVGLIAEGDICGAPLAGDQLHVELRASNMSLSYPNGWHLADVSLTPNLSNPTEVFSIGSFPLTAGGPNCAQVPSQAFSVCDVGLSKSTAAAPMAPTDKNCSRRSVEPTDARYRMGSVDGRAHGRPAACP